MADDLSAFDEAEDQVAAAVAAVLDEVAAEFAAELDRADEIVAARFSVGRIARMWANRLPRIVRRLLGVAEDAARAAAESVDAELPGDWEDLPGRYDDGEALPRSLSSYVDDTEHLLRAVGDRLAAVAVAELAAGLDKGDDIDALRARLRAAFAREGAQLGSSREERIARTEATRAWNAATLASGRDLSGPDRPLVKQWITQRDKAVRDAHAAVNGQVRLLGDAFDVAGVPMAAPGDPTAPPALTVNCRCRLALAPESRSAAIEPKAMPRPDGFDSEENDVHPVHTVTAADGAHRHGAMIALIPTQEDAERLAVADGEPAEELHLTLYFLGDGADWTEEQRNELIASIRVRFAAAHLSPVTALAFGVNHWNPASDSPSWVWAVGDDRERSYDWPTLADFHALAGDTLEDTHDRPGVPVQHSPWVPHVCAAYGDDPALLAELVARIGPVTFDRIRVAFAGDVTDIPLSPEEEEPMADESAAGSTIRSWSTPGDAALAFENTETGDGRIFSTGALSWDSAGPWPLQYADEMLMGHEGAELAGAIETLGREGDRITGTGVLYLTRPAGADAAMLLDEGAPLGVSVDLDDVDVEFVDRTIDADDEWLFASGHLAHARVLCLEDGAVMLSASTAAEWMTADGGALSRTRTHVQVITGPDGRISAAAVRAAFAGTGLVTAAAGDPDDPNKGMIVHSQQSGDLLLRITRARVRGATLVTMPAYDRARIVLDPVDLEVDAAASGGQLAAAGDIQQEIITYVRSSPVPVGARQVAQALDITMETARSHLVSASRAGRLVRIAPGQYVGPSTLPEGASPDDSSAGLETLEASAWSAMRDADPMPAAWFREPTAEELPPGSGGVHYAAGRIYGWVAQAGEPHAGFSGRSLTIESLGAIDTTHFLRARFVLDDGTFVKAGAFTMNVGHHRDGAECETSACQFDDTRTVAGIVTVGMNAGGMWFSGAAAPWLSEWDRSVFRACQPSYHMKQSRDGRWQLRAVLSVPVPGHSSPLLATAVAERANLALAASAASLAAPDMSGHGPDIAGGPCPDNPQAVSARSSGTGSDLPGQRPADMSGQRPDMLTSTILIAGLDGLVVGELTPNGPMGLGPAARRAEVERLAALMDNTPAPVAASPKGTH